MRGEDPHASQARIAGGRKLWLRSAHQGLGRDGIDVR
jgi:hypothetical protein